VIPPAAAQPRLLLRIPADDRAPCAALAPADLRYLIARQRPSVARNHGPRSSILGPFHGSPLCILETEPVYHFAVAQIRKLFQVKGQFMDSVPTDGLQFYCREKRCLPENKVSTRTVEDMQPIGAL
jgi:hypothetical protein